MAGQSTLGNLVCASCQGSADRGVSLAGQTVMWLAGAALLNQFIRYVICDRIVARAIKGPVPGVLKELAAVVVFMVAITAIVGLVFDQSVTAFLATMGAGSVILGLALRNLFADIFTGLAINIDRSFVIGDWVQVNEVAGVVIGQIAEIGWRCTSLITEEKTNVVIPNGILGIERMINITRPLESTRFEVKVTVEYSVSPERVKRVLLAALQSLDEIQGFDASKKPVVLIKDTSSLGVEYLLRYWIRPWNPISPTSAQDIVLLSVLKNLHIAGIALAYPKTDIYTARMPARQFDGHNQSDLVALLANTQLFRPLSHDDLVDISAHMKRMHLSAGETLIRQGDEGQSLYILIEGLLDVHIEVDGGQRHLGRTIAGDSIGEMSLLTGERRSATIRTVTESVVYEVDKQALSRIMERRPVLMEILSQTLAERQLGSELATIENGLKDNAERVDNFARQIMTRMRSFFDIR